MTKIYLSTYHALIESGYEDPESHIHQAAHIIVALEKDIVCKVNNEEYICRGIVIPSNTEHTILSDNTPVIVFLFEETTMVAEQLNQTKIIDTEAAARIADRYQKLVANAEDKTIGYKAFYAAVADMLKIKTPALKALDERIIEAITFIRENAGGDITVKEIAERVYMSESRFSHLFKSQTGISVASFLIMTKIIKAYDGIFTGKNITFSAVEAGFYSSAHFAAVNKKMFGIKASSLVGNVDLYRIAEI